MQAVPERRGAGCRKRLGQPPQDKGTVMGHSFVVTTANNSADSNQGS
jgi:hypothetical protein